MSKHRNIKSRSTYPLPYYSVFAADTLLYAVTLTFDLEHLQHGGQSSVITNRKSTTCFPMNLRWTAYVAPKLPKGAQKHKMAVIRQKVLFTWRKSATKFPSVKTVRDKVVRHSLAYLSEQKWFAGDIPYYVKIWPKLANSFKNADFHSIFARSDSAVTPSKKSSVNTSSKSTTSFPMSLSWTV